MTHTDTHTHTNTQLLCVKPFLLMHCRIWILDIRNSIH